MMQEHLYVLKTYLLYTKWWSGNHPSPTCRHWRFTIPQGKVLYAPSGVTAGGKGGTVPPDAAQRENQPTFRVKRGVRKKRKRRGNGKKGRKERRKMKEKRRKEKKEERRERNEGNGKERKRERKIFFPKYKVNKIDQNYNNVVYKWVKSDDFLRGGGNTGGGGVTPSP